MKLSDYRKLVIAYREIYNLDDWKFRLDGAKARLGYCQYNKRIISLSKSYILLNDECKVKDTLLHEIAHALVGRGNGHNQVWKQKAQSIGCMAQRVKTNVITEPGKIRMRCILCGKIHTQYRKPKLEYACADCCNKYNGGRFSKEYIMEVIKNG